MGEKKKVILALVVLLLIVGVFLGVWYMTRTPAVAGEKTITLEVVHGSGTRKEFPITTDAQYLGQALTEQEGLVEGEQGPYGLYIHTVDGERDDAGAKTWWCLTKEGEQVTTGVDVTPIQDGERYELTLTTGY